MSRPRSLIIGANGQLGSELARAIAAVDGANAVVTGDLASQGPVAELVHERVDVGRAQALAALVQRHAITRIYHLAAVLSAAGEAQPRQTWDLNMGGLLNVLELARMGQVQSVFWPSSIAVFGPRTPPEHTPQYAVTDPNTVYGISKLAGERWCAWYHARHGVDVRSLRYPGLISWRTPPGGGTTDYAIEIFHAARRGGAYECFLDAAQMLPMMYMDDATRAAIELMQAPPAAITERGSYNVSGLSFTPHQIGQAIARRIPQLRMRYQPDFRQTIAASWPRSIDDRVARHDWGWRPRFDLDALVDEMLERLAAADGAR